MKAIKEKFKKLIESDKLNTSYPVNKEDWIVFKGKGELSFNDYRICMYVHIPFCLSKCKFCEYIKYTKPSLEEETKYVDILINDMKKFISIHRNKILYGFDIGGGTPTCLSTENFKRLLVFIYKNMSFMQKSSDFEPSIETTFLTATKEKIKIISENGFKRISFGLQTLDKNFLKENDRLNPTYKKIKEVFCDCSEFGIEKINIDLMYGLKNQRKKDLKNSLACIEHFKPTQVTLYEFRTNILNIKEYKTKRQLFKQYKYLFKKLKQMGYYGTFGQNSFSLRKEDQGLSSYIRNRMINNVPYKGFGISAQSKSEVGVSYNLGKTNKPLSEILKNGTFFSEDTYYLPPEQSVAKYLAISGYCGRFDLNIVEEILEENPHEKYNKQFIFLKKKKLIKIIENMVFITKKGFKYYGAILALFYPEND